MSERGARRASSNKLTPWHLLLLIPYVAVLWVPFYNAVEPSVFGFPFFYIYQMAWVVLSSILVAIVYVATQ
ncbi:DUF3311 domain-containing protein [Lichenihabitans sp. PAMC28606]|uniref:DUF3311 domain-containing protein n=1 Tax=Lichenihabitans sp. PAMC28606 TaxID=2880932 RepID=UPI001D0AC3A0|nr:DUF3311 domain-containing protein [Lichenihabitans sp. PAMC28606]UDL95059.1 DUF3311 domain-containing protein [Lichenihabitans sp. PAMC28606]